MSSTITEQLLSESTEQLLSKNKGSFAKNQYDLLFDNNNDSEDVDVESSFESIPWLEILLATTTTPSTDIRSLKTKTHKPPSRPIKVSASSDDPLPKKRGLDGRRVILCDLSSNKNCLKAGVCINALKNLIFWGKKSDYSFSRRDDIKIVRAEMNIKGAYADEALIRTSRSKCVIRVVELRANKDKILANTFRKKHYIKNSKNKFEKSFTHADVNKHDFCEGYGIKGKFAYFRMFRTYTRTAMSEGYHWQISCLDSHEKYFIKQIDKAFPKNNL